MRKVFAQLMIILMCMPSLVCAMPLCETDIAPVERTTHCNDEPQANHPEKLTSPMLMSDCSDIDLAVSSIVQLGDEEDKLDVGDDLGDLPNALIKLIAAKQRIRGSPNEPFIYHTTPIYLATERLRI